MKTQHPSTTVETMELMIEAAPAYLDRPMQAGRERYSDGASLATIRTYAVQTMPYAPPMTTRAILTRIWLQPGRVLASVAQSSGYSWIAPIGFALLCFYAHFFILSALRAPHPDWILMRGVAGILLGWPLSAALLYLLSGWIGGFPHFASLLILSAWASLPLTLRAAVQGVYMLLTGERIASPGLTGLFQDGAFGSLADGWWRAGYIIAGRLDIYTLWWLALLVFSVRFGAGLSLRRSLLVVLGLALLILAGDGILLAA